ncbi:MAG: hypothetical protein KDK97_10890, partial [Verrucomicrobiales bacterium]|nr:hypothetical protein [Verrucomicrobiales bacterium]
MKTAPWPVGQKVVCCFDHFPSAVFEVFDAVPQEGGIYTISEVVWANEYATGRPSLSVRLAELPPIQPGHGSFGLWLRAYVYIALHGASGLRENAMHAVLNANYLRVRLRER